MQIFSVTRWGLLVPVTLGSWALFIWSGVSMYVWLASRYCHSDGSCEPIARIAFVLLYFGFPPLSAVLVELVAVIVAPSHKQRVLQLVFGGGAIAAIGLVVVGTASWIQLLLTVMAGGIAAAWLYRQIPHA